MQKEKHKMPYGLDYDQITDYIFIGTNVCCQTHFDKELIKIGIKANISLEEEHLDAPYGVEMFLWLPTKDLHAPTYDQLAIGVNTLRAMEANEIKVYVHCRLGHGRSPTLVAGYLIKAKGMSADEAVAFIKAKRLVIHLEEVQIAALKELERNK